MYFNYSDKDNLPLDVKFGTDSKYIVENNYDELTRFKFKTYTIPSTGSKINTSYSYVDWSSTQNRTTLDRCIKSEASIVIDIKSMSDPLDSGVTHTKFYLSQNLYKKEERP